jgi:hypothetical protein
VKSSIVRSSWLAKGGYRLDCSPYLGGALETEILLEKLSVRKDSLSVVTTGIYHAGRESRCWVDSPEFGAPFLGGGQLQRADLSDLPLISKNQIANTPAFVIRNQWTLITRSGTIGKMAFAREMMDGLAVSEDVLRVVPDKQRIPPGYLYAFLSSKFGVPLITSGTYGAVIQHLEAEHIASLPVPRFGDAFEKEIHELVEEASRCLDKFQKCLTSATEEVVSLNGLTEISRSAWSHDQRRLGWQQHSIRSVSLRALNYDSRIADYFEKIRQGRYSQLGALCEPSFFRGRTTFTRIDADEAHGIKLVGQREAFRIWPEGRTISKSSIEGLGLLVPAGTTLIPSHGTLGEYELYCKALYVTEGTSRYAFSGDFFRCVPLKDAIPPGYLFAFLRSQIAFRMLRSISVGGKQQEQNSILMYELPIPRLAPAAEQRISNLIEESAREFDRATSCEELARAKVESAISQT